jgi:predicted PurR-regulated permease PerM
MESLSGQRDRIIWKFPFYVKGTFILFGLILFVYTISVLKEILVPLCFSLLLAILLNPVANRLQQWKIPRLWAIIFSLLFGLLVLAGIGYFLYSQIISFNIELPAFRQKISSLVLRLQQAADSRLGIPVKKQDQFLDEAATAMKPVIGSTLGSIAGYISTVLLLPVYTFLFLYYKNLLLNFMYEIFREEHLGRLGIVLHQTKRSVQSYMVGLLIEGLIVAAMNVTALSILGVEYPILLGVMGAVLNILPFVGGILAVALPLLVATVTRDGFQIHIWIILSYMLIQFIDNHFLIPYIVSSRVKINALVSIVIVLLGGALWGISGMFLAIPFTGILKVIFDRIPELRPWGKLMGVEVPGRHKGQSDMLAKRVQLHSEQVYE